MDLADEAYFYAKRLLQLTREARVFAEKTPEQEVLWVEKKFQSFNEAIGSMMVATKVLMSRSMESKRIYRTSPTSGIL